MGFPERLHSPLDTVYEIYFCVIIFSLIKQNNNARENSQNIYYFSFGICDTNLSHGLDSTDQFRWIWILILEKTCLFFFGKVWCYDSVILLEMILHELMIVT